MEMDTQTMKTDFENELVNIINDENRYANTVYYISSNEYDKTYNKSLECKM